MKIVQSFQFTLTLITVSMLKKILFFIAVFFLINTLSAQELSVRLQELGFEIVKEFQSFDTNYIESYEMMIDQPIDPSKLEQGNFKQRVILRHRGFDRPTVMVTEGYDATYATYKWFNDELAVKLNANLVVVEHRFFGKSKPEKECWEDLNLKNATHDLHVINNLLKKIYTKPWISTGISKGGQTTIYYRYFYPEDVTVSVPYVAPLNFDDTDKRVYHFLDTVANAACRNKLQEIQLELLKNKAVYAKRFADSTTKRNLTFECVGGVDKGFELNVLELGFAYWQWYSTPCEDLVDLSKEDYFKVFVDAAGYDFFSDQGIESMIPFFWQAMNEMGFYWYDTEPFEEYLTEDFSDFSFAIPKGTKANYKKRLSKKVAKWLKNKGNNMIYVYGGYDAWSSTAAQIGDKTNAIKLIKPKGSHATRLYLFDEETQNRVYSQIKEWINIEY